MTNATSPSPAFATGDVIPTSRAARLRWSVADSWAMTRRYMAHVAHSPQEIVIYFSLPIMFVLVFGYVFGSAMTVPGDGSYREFLLPGVFAMAMVYGLGATATSVAHDVGRGVIDRFRSMPTARSALVAGRSVADLLRALLEMTVMVVCGLLVGWQWHRGIGNALVAIALVLLLRFALTWVGIYLGLLAGDPDTVAVGVFSTAFPVTAVSSVFVAPELMPGWLGAVAEWNPLSSTVAAARELFGNPGLPANAGLAEHAVLMALLWPLVLLAVFVPLSVRRYRRLSR